MKMPRDARRPSWGWWQNERAPACDAVVALGEELAESDLAYRMVPVDALVVVKVAEDLRTVDGCSDL